MAGIERRAEVTWEGSLVHGSGKVSVGSKAFGDLPLTWASRIERAGKASPEELIAAAHAGCYAMALTNTLAQLGTPAERLIVNAVCALEQMGGGLKITSMNLDVQGKIPGLDVAGLEQAAQLAEQACPVSNALRNNLEMHVNAHLLDT
jgi:lipoyl-dependent peroxiredoxin